MSWLNNSLNTIKGQLTNLAQEVLADTAGPGDDEYRGSELSAKTAVELLNETQLQKEQLEKTCEDKDREINALRKQITTLKTQKATEVTGGGGDGDVDSISGRNSGAKSSRSGEDQNVEDSWCWEPAGADAASAAAKSPTEAGMVDVALADGTNVGKLNAIIANLEQSNEELRSSLDMLDAQHEQAMQNMLGQKTQLQAQVLELKQQQADRLVAHELEMARIKAQLATEQGQHQSAAAAQQQLQQRVEQQDKELQRCVLELAEMQQLLEKRGVDNGELIERVRHADAEREKLQRDLDELVKQSKEKKTSESSNSSSTGKHSEDEFIVVRNADAAGSSSDPDAEATTPPTKEKLRDKLVALEARITELGAANAKLQDAELERQLAESVRQEQLSELETRLRISESEKEQLQLKLQRKLQQLMLQNQELKLNAEADQETHANDLERQLGTLRDENRQLRQELDASIAQAKFRQAIAEEKVTDLDLDQDQEQPDLGADNDPHKLRSLLEALVAEKSDLALERTHRLLNERWQRLETIERRLIELQEQQQHVEHEKRTLEADISQYILQCDELMKNNEVLLNELDKLKRNKLETIEEHHEETIAQLEAQLEEAQAQLRRQPDSDRSQLEQLNSQLALQSAELETKQAAFDALTASVEQVRQELDELQLAKQARESQLLSQLQQLEDHQSEKAAAQRKLQEQLDAKQLQLEELQTQLQALPASSAQIEQLKAQLHAKEEELQQELQLSEQNAELQLEATKLRAELEEKQQLLLDAVQCKEQLKFQLEELKIQHEEIQESPTLKQIEEQLESKEQQLTESNQVRVELDAKLKESREHSEQLKQQLEEQQQTLAESEELKQLRAEQAAGEQQLEQLRAQQAEQSAAIESLNCEKLELIKALQQKHAENTQYYAEIQRLQAKEQQLAELLAEREKLCDQISFLKEKSDILTTNLLTEQTNQRLLHQQQTEAQDQNANVQRDLERLRAHLVEIEELHTQESVELQRELDEARAKQSALQQEVSKSSTAYTSASIRANQQAETLQAQHGLLLQQRDELLAKLGQFEDREQKQQAALTNLQCALEQFQNDKEHDIATATQRMRREMLAKEEQQAQLLVEMGGLQQQLADANQGLRAAARLSDQLEAGQQTIAVLRDEVDSLKDANLKLEQSLSSSESSQTDKIDKSLIKSLLIGYVVSGHAGDKQQVLRMISSVLDFNVQEADKVGLNKPQSSWLGSILGGGGVGTSNSSPGNDNLLQAFVQFLEQESQPQSIAQKRPNLLSMANQLEPTSTQAPSAPGGVAAAGEGSAVAASTAMTTGGEQLTQATSAAAAALPLQSLHMTSNEFAPTRNSSSILKDILNDS